MITPHYNKKYYWRFKMKAAIYLRVSTQEQSIKGISLEAQEERLIQYCKSKEYQVSKIYKDVHTGKDDKRKQFQSMISDAKENKFDIIIVLKLDRFMRNVRTLLNILDEFENNDIKFTSITENFDTSTAMGKAVLRIIAVVAELESGLISERVKFVRKHQLEQGKAINRPAFGYKINKKKKRYELHEENSLKVKMIFSDFSMGKNLHWLAKQYQKSRQGIKKILTNAVYTGSLDNRPLIIHNDEFLLVQEKLNEKKVPKYLTSQPSSGK